MKKCPNCQFEQAYWKAYSRESHAPDCNNKGFMQVSEYYTPPSDEAFEAIKMAACMIWQTYDNEYGYATEKIESINNLTNVKDNYAHIFSMFDSNNQRALIMILKNEEALKKIDWLRKYNRTAI